MRSAPYWGALACGGCAWDPAADPGVSIDTAATECATEATLSRRSSKDPDVQWTISRSDGALTEAVGSIPALQVISGEACSVSARLNVSVVAEDGAALAALVAYYSGPLVPGSEAGLADDSEAYAAAFAVDQAIPGLTTQFEPEGASESERHWYYGGSVRVVEATEERLTVRVEGEDLHGVDVKGTRTDFDWVQLEAEVGSTPFPLALSADEPCQTGGSPDPLGSGLCVGWGEGSSYPCPCPVELPWSAE